MIGYLVRRCSDAMSMADSRVEHLPLMGSPLPTIALCFMYVYFVKVLGPAIMQNRKPFNIRTLMIAHNLSLVIFSCVLVFKGARRYLTEVSLACAPVRYDRSPGAMEELYSSYAYYLSKFFELFDTVFFVLRKKNQHVSALHVLHHGIMPFSVWWGVKFVPGGHAIFFGWANSIIHAIMYTYYGLAAFGPHMQKYLWWKKYLTLLQIIQFVAIGVHSFQLLFRECNFPKIFVWWIGFHGLLFLGLFIDFYNNAYMKKVPLISRRGKDVLKGEIRQKPVFGCTPNLMDYESNNNVSSKLN